MANVAAIHSVGSSIAAFLRNTYPQNGGMDMPACRFDLVSSGQLAADVDEETRVTLYLYRITVNEHSRQVRRQGGSRDHASLSVDLHYLLTAWASSPLEEQVCMAWAMRQLHQAPVLDASMLSPEAGWQRDEVVQVIPSELSNEDIMRIWDALHPSYRLSASYVARVVRLDPDVDTALHPPVVERRLALGAEAPR